MKKKIIAVFSAVLILGLLMFTAVSAAGKAELSGGNVNGYAGGIIGYLEGIINLENNSFEQGIPAKEVGYSTSEK